MLPFTADVFFANFETYNGAIWPAQIVAYVLGLTAVGLTFSPIRGSGRLIGLLLAAAWAWNGVAYHIMHFATINFLAPAFGAVFILQALLFVWTLAIRNNADFRVTATPPGLAGIALIVFALAVYPLLGWLGGHGWPQAPLFGVAPCPTVIFTFGLLLLIQGHTPLHLIVIPLLWSLVGGVGAWLLNIPEDYALPVAGIGGFILILWKNHRHSK